MSLSTHKQTWDSLARFDPMWAILTTEEKKGGKWTSDEFFAQGRSEIRLLMEHLGEMKIPYGARRALDFGCGVGRLSQALAEHFESVTGVDISSEMIEKAKIHNKLPSRCTYMVNETTNLQQFADGTFSFVYSNMVLQHIAPWISREYMKEFIRVLEPNGLVVFQMPGFIPWKRRIQWRRRAFHCLEVLGFHEEFLIDTLGLNPMRMSFLSRESVEALLIDNNARILETTSWTGLDILSHRYIARKLPPNGSSTTA